jgi:hypothetical protein
MFQRPWVATVICALGIAIAVTSAQGVGESSSPRRHSPVCR